MNEAHGPKLMWSCARRINELYIFIVGTIKDFPGWLFTFLESNHTHTREQPTETDHRIINWNKKNKARSTTEKQRPFCVVISQKGDALFVSVCVCVALNMAPR